MKVLVIEIFCSLFLSCLYQIFSSAICSRILSNYVSSFGMKDLSFTFLARKNDTQGDAYDLHPDDDLFESGPENQLA
jgi:hypothetical protein